MKRWLLFLLLCGSVFADTLNVEGERLYGLRYQWNWNMFTVLDTVSSDTISTHRLTDTLFEAQVVVYNIDLPTPVSECIGWSVQIECTNLLDVTPWFLCRTYPINAGEEFSLHEVEDYWAQYPMTGPLGVSDITFRSPESTHEYHQFLLNQDYPNVERLVLVCTVPLSQFQIVNAAIVLWERRANAVDERIRYAAPTFSVYPNPIEGSGRYSGTAGELQVYNVLGRLCWSGQVRNGQMLELDNLARGAYYVTLRTPSPSALPVVKLIKL